MKDRIVCGTCDFFEDASDTWLTTLDMCPACTSQLHWVDDEGNEVEE